MSVVVGERLVLSVVFGERLVLSVVVGECFVQVVAASGENSALRGLAFGSRTINRVRGFDLTFSASNSSGY